MMSVQMGEVFQTSVLTEPVHYVSEYVLMLAISFF